MSGEIFGAALFVAVVMLPVLLQWYVQRLPQAPGCPTCRVTTRPLQECALERMVPLFASTSRGECTRCGWRGRMRWRWATRTVPRRR